MAGPSLPRIAWRNLWRNRRRTVLTLVSIAFGFLFAVLFTALQDRNFADMIDVAARNGAGHVSLQHPEYLDSPTLTRTVADASRLVRVAEADPGVARAVARISGPLMLATAGKSQGAWFIGYDPAQEDTGSFSMLDAIDGDAFADGDDKGIILGRKLAENLDVGLGDKVVYTLMDRQGEIVSGLGRLSAVIDTGADPIDAGIVLLPIDRLRDIIGFGPDEATQVAVFAGDSRDSARVARRLTGEISGAVALPWDEVQPELSAFIAMKVGGARVMEGIIMILVAAGIFNTMLVSVMERTREFGIQLAIGWSPSQVFRMVMWEAAWLGLVGLALGAALTWWPYSYLARTGIDLSTLTGDAAQQMDVAGVGMEPILRVGIFPENLAIIAVGVVLATLAAAVVPAWRAGRTVPVDSIKLV